MKTKTKRDLDGMEARRREGMRLLARGVSQAEVARQCGYRDAAYFCRVFRRLTNRTPGEYRRA